ncbi:MAG: pyridoxal phosphate-dependent aminotransferase [Fimbriimonas sp.]
MPLRVSKRAEDMPASPIRRLVPFAEEAVARGTKIYHLNIGQPDVESPAEFWAGIASVKQKVLEYGHSAGLRALRERAALAYREIGLEVTTDQLMVTTAGSEAVAFALQVVCDAGDEVIIPEPMYANYLGFAEAAGVRVVPVTTTLADDFRLPGASAFEAKITPKTRAIMICNPGNPTGVVYTRDQLEGLRDLAVRHGLFLIADEVYREFSYLGGRPVSVLELEGLDEHAIMIDSVSKRFSLCGARIGFFVSRNAEVNAAALKFAQARLSPPTLESLGVLAAMETPTEYFAAVRAEYQTRRDLVVRRLRAIPGVRCPQIDGAFYATVELPVDDADHFCRWLLESFSHEGETVMLAPASGFYATEGLGKSEVRIAYVLNLDSLDRAMDLLERALTAYQAS